MAYGVQHKENGKWFGGFDKNCQTLWVDQANALRMNYQGAKTQAALFLSSAVNQNAQRKPKVLN